MPGTAGACGFGLAVHGQGFRIEALPGMLLACSNSFSIAAKAPIEANTFLDLMRSLLSRLRDKRKLNIPTFSFV